MRAPASPTELDPVRIIDLFPFPVLGRNVAALWAANSDNALGRLGLRAVSREGWDLDAHEHFAEGQYDPICGVYAEASGKQWALVLSDGKETLVELPLKEVDYAPGDKVYSKLNPHLPYLFGTVKRLCPPPILNPFQCVVVEWKGDPGEPHAFPVKDIALFNHFTTPRPPCL